MFKPDNFTLINDNKKFCRIWVITLLSPLILFAIATWCVLLFPGLSIKAAEICMLKSPEYDRGCWVKARPEIIITGSSTARYGIIPAVISSFNRIKLDKIVNLGYNSATPLQNWAAYTRNIDKFKNAKIVYYTLDPWMLSAKYYKLSINERVLWNYKQWQHMQKIYDIHDGFFLPWKNIAKSIFRKDYKCAEARNMGFEPLGHKPLEKLDFIDLNIYDDLSLFGPSKLQISYIAKLKKAVEENGAEFILVLTPKHEKFVNLYARKKEWEKLLTTRLNKQLGKTKIIGTLYGPRYKLKEHDYFDHFHLTPSGANIFTALEFHDLGLHKLIEKSVILPLPEYMGDKGKGEASDADVMVELGILYMYGNMINQACIQFNKALDFEQNNARARDNISRFCFSKP